MKIKTTDEISFCYPKDKQWVAVDDLIEWLKQKEQLLDNMSYLIEDIVQLSEKEKAKRLALETKNDGN